MQERQVSLFRNGRNQAIRIPREFELDGNKAIIRKEGDRLVIEPISQGNKLLRLLESLKPINEVFQQVEDVPIIDKEIF